MIMLFFQLKNFLNVRGVLYLARTEQEIEEKNNFFLSLF